MAQSVNGTETSFVWDWASGLPEMLSDSSNLYLVGHETLGQWDGASPGGAEEWTYYLPDALGSIRQTTDEAGSVTASREWTPFGVEVGTGQSGLGYTGEWWDDNAEFLYLRARWLSPQMGRFTQVDPWSGNHQQPLTMNPYLYALANPLQYVDPTGYFPTEQDILEGNAEFTCNCGWIDWNHVRKSDGIGYGLADDLEYATNNFRSNPYVSNNWGIYVGIPLGQWGVEFDLFGEYAVIPHSQLSIKSNRESLATSIFMDANERFEELQGEWGNAGIEKLQSSYYSEEDLPSDIIGYWIGLQRLYTGSDPDPVYEQVRKKCGAVGPEASMRVFRDAYGEGTRALTNWRVWRARVLPLTGCDSYLCRCNSSSCSESGSRTWPSEFATLTSRRIYPDPSGKWWWYRGLYEDGFVVEEMERSRVIRFGLIENQ